ncbi:hypothetical protein AVEN_227646-1, partial [Araneus ventricosus]
KWNLSCIVNTRSRAKMADNVNLLALLANMKKSMEAGQVRIKQETHSGHEKMDKGHEE